MSALDLQTYFDNKRRTLTAPLDFDGGKLVIVVESPIDLQMRAPCCAKEPETARWLRENVQRGDVLYDVGANVGAYSLIAASLGAEVYSFEPVVTNLDSLVKNLRLNHLESRVVPMPIALADGRGVLRFRSDREGMSGTNARRDPIGQPALVMPMDQLFPIFAVPHPTLLKVDVEGMELDVLRGAETCVMNVRSAIVECTARTMTEVERWMNERGLQTRAEHPRIEPGTHNVEFCRTAPVADGTSGSTPMPYAAESRSGSRPAAPVT